MFILLTSLSLMSQFRAAAGCRPVNTRFFRKHRNCVLGGWMVGELLSESFHNTASKEVCYFNSEESRQLPGLCLGR